MPNSRYAISSYYHVINLVVNDYFDAIEVLILLDIWSYDLGVMDDYQGSMVEIGELNDVVVIVEVNETEEDFVHIGDLIHDVIYPLTIS